MMNTWHRYVFVAFFSVLIPLVPLNSAESIKEGDLVRAPQSNDIYIINSGGYKRLFLNPIVFSFYGHLGGFGAVKTVSNDISNSFKASLYFRNCEAKDPKVYTLEPTSEDGGIIHWLNISGDNALTQDPYFFKKVFCINNKEFGWYPKGEDYNSLTQLPQSLKDLPQAPEPENGVAVDLKINGSDQIGAVSWGSPLTASWTANNSTRCEGLNYLSLKDSVDITNLPAQGSVEFYAKIDFAPVLEKVLVQILCYGKGGDYVDDYILINIK